MWRANLSEAVLYRAKVTEADLSQANLSDTNLSEAELDGVDFTEANLARADLTKAELIRATLVKTNCSEAILTNCRVYGISAWNVQLDRAKQENLVITDYDEPTIMVDNLKIAQFIYLLLNNEEIRDAIDTIAKKAVLILGRFTFERKVVLDNLREELRTCGYLPILFDFEKPSSRSITETVRTLAHLARFIIADLTDPSSIPQELQAIIPTLAVPVQPVLLEGKREYSMFVDFLKTYHWVLPIHYYTDQTNLLTTHCAKLMHDGKPFCYLKTLAPCIVLSCSFQLYSLVDDAYSTSCYFCAFLERSRDRWNNRPTNTSRGAFLPSRHDDDH